MRVRNLENKNQFIISTKNGTFFQSYETIIACYKDGQLILNIDYWNYSKTTLKYLYLFIYYIYDRYCDLYDLSNKLKLAKKALIDKLIKEHLINTLCDYDIEKLV